MAKSQPEKKPATNKDGAASRRGKTGHTGLNQVSKTGRRGQDDRDEAAVRTSDIHPGVKKH